MRRQQHIAAWLWTPLLESGKTKHQTAWLNAMIFSTTPGRVSLVLKIYRIVKLIGVQINPETDFIAKHGIPRFDHCQLKRYSQNRRNYAKGSVYQYGQLARINYALNPAKRTKCGTFLAIFHVSESITDLHNNFGQISRVIQQGRVSKRWIQRFAIIWASS